MSKLRNIRAAVGNLTYETAAAELAGLELVKREKMGEQPFGKRAPGGGQLGRGLLGRRCMLSFVLTLTEAYRSSLESPWKASLRQPVLPHHQPEAVPYPLALADLCYQ